MDHEQLETKVNEHGETLAAHSAVLSSLRESVGLLVTVSGDLRVAIGELNTTLKGLHTPATCPNREELHQMVETQKEHGVEIEQLKQTRWTLQGGSKVLLAILSVVTPLLISAMVWLTNTMVSLSHTVDKLQATVNTHLHP